MEQVKVYDPQEPVAVTLTREEWGTVLHCIQASADFHRCKKAETLANMKGSQMSAHMMTEHERAAAERERLYNAIEGVLIPAPPPETE